MSQGTSAVRALDGSPAKIITAFWSWVVRARSSWESSLSSQRSNAAHSRPCRASPDPRAEAGH